MNHGIMIRLGQPIRGIAIMRLQQRIFSIIAIAVLTGCAFNKPTGPVFSPHALSNVDQALVYFYRPQGESFGYDRTYFVGVNDRKIGDLLHGGYFPYQATAGKAIVISDVNRSARTMIHLVGAVLEAAANPQAAKLELELKPGNTYYIRMSPEARATHFIPRLTLMPREEGEKEISSCKLIINEQ